MIKIIDAINYACKITKKWKTKAASEHSVLIQY